MSWPEIALGYIAEFRNGLNYTTDNEGEGLRIINVKDFGDKSFPDYDELSELNPHGILRDEALLKHGDIVFVRSNGNKDLVGRSLFVNNPPENVSFSAFCIRARLNSSADPRFYSYFFRTPNFRKRLALLGKGTNISNLNQQVLKRIIIPNPSNEEKSRIVSLICTYDDLIENNRRRIQLLEQAARLLYKEWFVHLRFPSHEHVKIEDGVPEGWGKMQVKDVLGKVKRSQKIKKTEFLKEGIIPCIDQSKNFIGGYTDDEEAVIDIDKPVIVFGDHTRTLKFVDFPFACGADGTQLIVSNDEAMSQEYLYLALDKIDLSNYFYARHFKFLKDQYILRPSNMLLSQFTDNARPILKQIKSLRNYNHYLIKARDLLLPRLMNGEVVV
jgi:type I restriction enzyme S subunit